LLTSAHLGEYVPQDSTNISRFIEIINDRMRADARGLRCPAGSDMRAREIAFFKMSHTTFAFIRYHSHSSIHTLHSLRPQPWL